MKLYQLEFRQSIPVTVKEAWSFFSSPLNLSKITPKEMDFTVTSNMEQASAMYPGMIISYKVSPLPGLRLSWVTEITHVMEDRYFVDEQRFGPYQFWHHEHHFKEIPSGVLMHDMLTYGLPLGIIGQGVNKLIVASKIRQIFEFRKMKIIEMFGDYPAVAT